MKPKSIYQKIILSITLPVDVVQFLYKCLEHEERTSTIKRNISSIIYRALKHAHPTMPQYNIDEIYSKRKRDIKFSTYAQSETPLFELLSKEEQDERIIQELEEQNKRDWEIEKA